jgi:hypothetical protein
MYGFAWLAPALSSPAAGGLFRATLEGDHLRRGTGAFSQRGAQIDGSVVLFEKISERLVGELLKGHHAVARQKV